MKVYISGTKKTYNGTSTVTTEVKVLDVKYNGESDFDVLKMRGKKNESK